MPQLKLIPLPTNLRPKCYEGKGTILGWPNGGKDSVILVAPTEKLIRELCGKLGLTSYDRKKVQRVFVAGDAE